MPFELVVTGVTKADAALIEGFAKDGELRKTLNIPENLAITVITEEEIKEWAVCMSEGKEGRIDLKDPAVRAGLIKGLSLRKPLIEGECMAVVTEPVDGKDVDGLITNLAKELSENISIRVVGRNPLPTPTVYSLSDIIGNWLRCIQKGKKSTIDKILPLIKSPAEMIVELEQALRAALEFLSQA
jgi:hypothetical protein